MKEKTLTGMVDDEESEIRMAFDEEEGYIIFTLDDYNETEVKFDCPHSFCAALSELGVCK